MEQTLNEILPIHYEFLKQADAFPAECVLSSHLLHVLLKKQFPSIKIVYGTWGGNHLFHAWLQLENIIIDVTLFQFLTHKEKRKFYLNSNGDELINYAACHQGSFIITSDSPYNKYHEISVIQPLFHENPDTELEEFYKKIIHCETYKEMSWRKSLTESDVTFYHYLESRNYYVTKQFFTKYAIIKRKGA